jgi:hypothetical protein
MSDDLVDALVTLELDEELKVYAEGVIREEGGYDPCPMTRVLEALVRMGEMENAFKYMKEHVRRHGFHESCDHYDDVIRAAAAEGPEGPMLLLEFFASYPDRDEETRALVDAFRACSSADGLKRALAELPEPPVSQILAALIGIGEIEPVLEEALAGEFWYEAASVLRLFTGTWQGYFGSDWTRAEAPEKTGFFLVNLAERQARSTAAHRIPSADREAAVRAWRAALKNIKTHAGTEESESAPSEPR